MFLLAVDEKPLVTRDPDELMAKLNATTLGKPNGDCPEPSMQALTYALLEAEQNSIAFVFSDASAKDYDLYNSVSSLIQTKQITVYFLLTGNCGSPNSLGFTVYEKVSRVSGGQVFNMNRNEISDVLRILNIAMEANFVSLRSVDYDVGGESVTFVDVDKSFTRFSVSVSGTKAQLTIYDPNNAVVTSDDSFSSANIKIINFDVVRSNSKTASSNSTYTIKASATSAYSIRIGGISDLSFRFGFSTEVPRSETDTYLQPLVGHKNILSIFISDLSMVKCLTQATLVPASTLDSFDDVEIPLKRVNGGFFSTDFLDLPGKMFRIQIHGFDAEGGVINRVISTGIDSVSASEFKSLEFYLFFI